MRYLYYKIWQLFTKIKTNDMPATNAMLFVIFCQLLNIALVVILTLYYFKIKIDFNSSKLEAYLLSAVIFFPLLIIDYLILYKQKDSIQNKFSKESKKQRAKGNVIVSIYIIASFVLLFYFGPKYTDSIAS